MSIGTVTVGLLLLIVTFIVYFFYFSGPRRRRTKLPATVPRAGLPRQGLLDYLSGKTLPEVYQRRKEFYEKGNGVCCIGDTFLLTNDPDAARTIFMTHNDDFPKILVKDFAPNSFMNRLFGTNVVFSNDALWKRHRKVVNPAFKKSWNPEIFADVAFKLCDQWDGSIKAHNGIDAQIEVSFWMGRLTLDALGMAVFGYDFQAVTKPQGNEIVELYNGIFEPILSNPFYSLFPSWTPFPWFKKLKRDMDRFDELVLQIINDRRKEKNRQGKEPDVLDLMLQATDADSEAKFTEEELRDNAIIYYIAGHETTANTLSAILYHLAVYQQVQDILLAEFTTALGPDPSKVPTFDQQAQFRMCTAVIKETLRLFPPAASGNPRILKLPNPEDSIEICGHQIKSGTVCNVDLFATNRNPKYWPNPDLFDPTRFLKGSGKEDEENQGGQGMHPYQFIAFSGGQRQCLGMNFAYVEMRTVLSILVRKYRFSLPTGSIHESGYKLKFGALLNPKPLTLIVERR